MATDTSKPYMSKNSPIPFRFLMHPVHFLALGLGSGMPRYAPGTWGTFAALVLYVAADQIFSGIQWYWLLLTVVLTAALGVYLCDRTARDLGVHDHSGIVWDEFVGFWLCLIWLPVTWIWLLAAFVLFRFFDIVKPWPIQWADQRVSGGFGIMLDDLIAGLYTLMCLQLALYVIN